MTPIRHPRHVHVYFIAPSAMGSPVIRTRHAAQIHLIHVYILSSQMGAEHQLIDGKDNSYPPYQGEFRPNQPLLSTPPGV